MTNRCIRFGFRLDDEANPVPIPGKLQVEYSVDPWYTAPHGYVTWLHNGGEYCIAKSDLDRFEAAAVDALRGEREQQ